MAIETDADNRKLLLLFLYNIYRWSGNHHCFIKDTKLLRTSYPYSLCVCVLSKHNVANIWKQKYIGTRKHNSEAVAQMSHKHVAKDSDGSTKDVSSENIQGTTLHTTVGDERNIEHGDGGGKQRGDKIDVVEPRSDRDVLVDGGK